MTRLLLLALMAVLAIAAVAVRAGAKVAEGGPDRLDDTKSLADRIKAGRTVHIVFVHGMRAEGPGAGDAIVALLERELRFTPGAPKDIDLAVGPWPDQAAYLGSRIWRTQAEWDASQPFVRRTELSRGDGAKVVVDEVNWWPMIFALKCRFLIVPEHDLSGDDRKHLELCRRNDGRFHDWIDKADMARLARKPKGGGAALANRALKQQIMNWGLADAVIANGPMRPYLNLAMDRAFEVAGQGSSDDNAFVVMSESLGSFVVLDAMAAGSQPVANVIERSDDLYFFANQFALLELGRLGNLPPPPAAGVAGLVPIAPPATRPSPLETLRAWGRSRRLLDRPRQIIAFSDPSDLLTYVVPAIEGVKVVNLYDRNATRWFGLFANPAGAHTGHLRNASVWKVLIRQTAAIRAPRPPGAPK